MLKSSGAMAVATLASRVLGLAREMVYAAFMGASWVADAFIMAFMIPNLFRRLLGEGALTAAFIPIFKEKEKLAGEPEMWRAANAIISGLVLTALGLVILAVIGISIALATGIPTGKTRLMLELLCVMSPYLLLVCLAAILMGMLNARGHFFIPALGAALLNVVMIASVLWLAPRFGVKLEQQIFGLAVGVVIAGLVQASFQLPLLNREGFRYQWVTPWSNETVRHVVKQMIPGIIGVAAFQINIVITYGFSFWVEDEIISSFNYAVRLLELPQGVFGVSLATYLLPTLSGLAAEKKYPEFRSTLGQGLGYLIFVNLLASVLLLVLAEPTIRLLFERRRFDSYDTSRAAIALAWLAPGLVAFSMVNILARGFYALGDLKTPMKISVFCLGLNAILAIALVWHFRQAGLGAANTITSCINAALLLFALRKKLARLNLGSMLRHLPGVAGAAVVAGVAAWLAVRQWDLRWGHESLPLRLGEVFAPMLAAGLIYFAICHWLRVPYTRDLLGLLPRRSGGQSTPRV
ncbi:MAG: murein biosynthesis integral membrane protein MurJ [Verrucomicrobia subdivision 3 bacterium]|nr:murein biosynthesis integral membrane protein MurJ [Limisphaerales bacterium]